MVTSLTVRCDDFIISGDVRCAEDVLVDESYIALVSAASAGLLPPLGFVVDEASIHVFEVKTETGKLCNICKVETCLCV